MVLTKRSRFGERDGSLGLHSGGFHDLQEFRREERIPIMHQISLADQEAFRPIAEVGCYLAHPMPIGILVTRAI